MERRDINPQHQCQQNERAVIKHNNVAAKCIHAVQRAPFRCSFQTSAAARPRARKLQTPRLAAIGCKIGRRAGRAAFTFSGTRQCPRVCAVSDRSDDRAAARLRGHAPPTFARRAEFAEPQFAHRRQPIQRSTGASHDLPALTFSSSAILQQRQHSWCGFAGPKVFLNARQQLFYTASDVHGPTPRRDMDARCESVHGPVAAQLQRFAAQACPASQYSTTRATQRAWQWILQSCMS